MPLEPLEPLHYHARFASKEKKKRKSYRTLSSLWATKSAVRQILCRWKMPIGRFSLPCDSDASGRELSNLWHEFRQSQAAWPRKPPPPPPQLFFVIVQLVGKTASSIKQENISDPVGWGMQTIPSTTHVTYQCTGKSSQACLTFPHQIALARNVSQFLCFKTCR